MTARCGRTRYDPGKHKTAISSSTRENDTFLIEVDRLGVSYYSPYEAAHRALDNISFRISAGEGVGLLGESGAGKSTLALALLGLLPRNARVKARSIRFRGRNILDLDEDELRKVRGAQIAFISQEPAAALNPVMRVGDQICEVLRAHRNWDRKRRRDVAHEMLRQVRLPQDRPVSSAYPHELSGGEQQRVAIGQALVCEPALLIADEPTSALDTSRRAEVLACLKDAKARHNMAILMITHDPTTLVGVAHRVLVLQKGELVRETTVEEVMEQPVDFIARSVRSKFARSPSSQSIADLYRPAGAPYAPNDLTLAGPADNCVRITPPSASSLVVVRLHKKYQKRNWITGSLNHSVLALDGASLALQAGKTTCLVGESGSGKSTLARCMALLEQPDSGEVRLDGCDLLGLSSSEMRRRRRSIQLLMQNTAAAFNPSLTVEETIAEPLNFGGLSRVMRHDRSVALMEKVGLPASWRRRKPPELSGGQRQRLAIARALAAGPAVLIFDEALNGLDLPVQAKMIELLWELQKSLFLTYLFITHNIKLARYIADEIAVMHCGKIVECGSPADILWCPRPEQSQTSAAPAPLAV